MNLTLTPGIRFIVTSLCNYNCTYCHNEWEPKTKPLSGLELKLIDELIGSVKDLGGSGVDITGGEPLLKADKVKAILVLAKKHGMHTNLTTNGYFLSRDAEMLYRIGLDEIHIHIPSLNHSLYKSLMRGNADLDKVLSGLEKIKSKIHIIKANIPIELGINDAEIPRFLEYFNRLGIIPRFIETMTTSSYKTEGQRIFDELIKLKLEGHVSLRNSYLWGINEYENRGRQFETLRCICFDRKCDICQSTNFVHIDQNYKIRPCNLRPFKIQATTGNCSQQVREAIRFLEQQTDIPEEYKRLWGESYVPLTVMDRFKTFRGGTES